MLQTVPKTPDGLDEPNVEPRPAPEPQSLADRLDAEFPIGARLAAKGEPTASCMAERFAPQPLRATREEAPLKEALGYAPPGNAVPSSEPRASASRRQGVLVVLTGVAICACGDPGWALVVRCHSASRASKREQAVPGASPGGPGCGTRAAHRATAARAFLDVA